ncbi:MFS transporter [Amnibacterium sp.]|uniref:MFS transporter n=1 Tax=Amnibacterium sp. TaxID=1872496 RepID=UPI00260A72DC|nr:MFS transporter [Amnibacterium sp.]MCU1472965.1 transporter [Amnibacterium sp.]
MAADRRAAGVLNAARAGTAVVAAAAVCVGVGGFDLGAVNVVLPHLAATFQVTPAAVQWVSIAYLLPIAALALPTGRWLDTIGRRPAMLLLVAGFTVCSVVAALAPMFGALIAARVAQGAFGAGLFAICPALAYESVPPERRVRTVAIVSTFGAAGGIAGPPIGALVTELAGWPWVFLVNVPILGATMVVFALALRPGAPLTVPGIGFLSESLLLGGGAAAVLLALTFAARDVRWLLLAVAAIPLAATWRRAHPDSPVLTLGRAPGFRRAASALALLAASTLSVQYLLAFLAQRSLGLSATVTGGALLFVSVAAVAGSLLAARLTARWRQARISAAGFLLFACGVVASLTVGRGAAALLLGLVAVVLGFGQGLANTPATAIGLSYSTPESMGSTGAAISFLRNVGFTAGPAVVTLIWAADDYTESGLRIALGAVAVVAAVGSLVVVRSAPVQPAATG